ncbi:MAG: glycoside hydrolase family protein [Marinagarivorans sp.]|nr:glycoside hydrolase family protein [Marinagarivorans sp.]
MVTALEVVEFEEGFKSHPYYCTEGFPTYGHGFRCGKKGDALPKISITLDESKSRLSDILAILDKQLQTLPAYKHLSETRHAILVSMCYQVGFEGLKLFKKFLSACEAEDWKEAARQMLDSKAARQTPARWRRAALAMETGAWRIVK